MDEMDVREIAPGHAAEVIEPPPRKTYRRPDPLPDEMVRAVVGRPGVYHEDFPELARRLSLVGLSDTELAKVFMVHVDTVYQWDKDHPEFSEARARGGVIADGNVVERLYRRATGFTRESVKIFMPAGADEPVYAPFTEYFPPETQAAIWWLKNRQKKYWKDSHIIAGDPDNPLQVQEVAATRQALIDRLQTLAKPEPLTIEGEPSSER